MRESAKYLVIDSEFLFKLRYALVTHLNFIPGVSKKTPPIFNFRRSS